MRASLKAAFATTVQFYTSYKTYDYTSYNIATFIYLYLTSLTADPAQPM